MTNSSETFVTLPECKVVSITQRSVLVECPLFPDDTSFGKRRLHVHLAFMSPVHGMPDPEGPGGPLVVNRRFVIHYGITGYDTDLPEPLNAGGEEQ